MLIILLNEEHRNCERQRDPLNRVHRLLYTTIVIIIIYLYIYIGTESDVIAIVQPNNVRRNFYTHLRGTRLSFSVRHGVKSVCRACIVETASRDYSSFGNMYH